MTIIFMWGGRAGGAGCPARCEQIDQLTLRSLGKKVSQKSEGGGNEHHSGYAELCGRKFYLFIDHLEIGFTYNAEFKTHRGVIKTNYIVDDKGHEEVKFEGDQVAEPGVQYGRCKTKPGVLEIEFTGSNGANGRNECYRQQSAQQYRKYINVIHDWSGIGVGSCPIVNVINQLIVNKL